MSMQESRPGVSGEAERAFQRNWTQRLIIQSELAKRIPKPEQEEEKPVVDPLEGVKRYYYHMYC